MHEYLEYDLSEITQYAHAIGPYIDFENNSNFIHT